MNCDTDTLIVFCMAVETTVPVSRSCREWPSSGGPRMVEDLGWYTPGVPVVMPGLRRLAKKRDIVDLCAVEEKRVLMRRSAAGDERVRRGILQPLDGQCDSGVGSASDCGARCGCGARVIDSTLRSLHCSSAEADGVRTAQCATAVAPSTNTKHITLSCPNRCTTLDVSCMMHDASHTAQASFCCPPLVVSVGTSSTTSASLEQIWLRSLRPPMMMVERNSALPSHASSSAPSLSSDPFLCHLHARLTEAEHAFLLADFHTAATQSQDILHALITLTSSFSSPAPLLPPTHSCTTDCVCTPAFLLLVQATLQSTPPADCTTSLNTLITTYYQSPTRLPYDALLAVSWWQVRAGQYEAVVQQAVGWLEARKRDNERVKDSEYVALLELVVLYALCPLGEFSEAAMLVRRSERLGKERREAWLRTVRQLEEQQHGTATTRLPAATGPASMPSQQQLLPAIEEKKENEQAASDPTDAIGQSSGAVVPSEAAPSSFAAVLASLHTRLLLRLHAMSPTAAWRYQQLLSALSLHHRLLMVCLVLLLVWRYRSVWSGAIERPLQQLQHTAVWSGLRAEVGNLAQLALSSGFGRLFW